jgi:hypothetical protein
MAKAKVLNVEGKVRKATIKFAQALLDAGVNVKRVYSEVIEIKGKGRFSLYVDLAYDCGYLAVSVLTRKGHIQTQAECATYTEFKALLTTWNIAAY